MRTITPYFSDLWCSGPRQCHAQSVAGIFLNEGFKQTNLNVIGRGSNQPFVPNTSDENRASNRRVAIIIIP